VIKIPSVAGAISGLGGIGKELWSLTPTQIETTFLVCAANGAGYSKLMFSIDPIRRRDPLHGRRDVCTAVAPCLLPTSLHIASLSRHSTSDHGYGDMLRHCQYSNHDLPMHTYSFLLERLVWRVCWPMHQHQSILLDTSRHRDRFGRCDYRVANPGRH
jgi:hypothetical protein